MNKITFPLKSAMTGPEVADLQDALQHLLFHGGFEIDDETRLREYSQALLVDRTRQTYGLATYKLVRMFQAERRLQVSGELDEPTAGALNAQLGLEEGDRTIYQVMGRVSSPVGGSLEGLRVGIVDKTVGDDVQLAEATTDDGGAYLATFTSDELRARGKAQPDLQARVFAGEVFLGASDVRYNASNRETLNVVLEEKSGSTLRSEHEVLTGALAGHFKGKLGDLKETDEQQDITYLANKTGWDARAVALAALADQFSARTAAASGDAAIPQAFFYALFRAGLPANEDTLYHTDARTLEAVWKKAAEQGVIPKALGGPDSGMVQRFRTLSAQKLLTGPALVGVVVAEGDADRLPPRRRAADNSSPNSMPRIEPIMPTFWDAVERLRRGDGQAATGGRQVGLSDHQQRPADAEAARRRRATTALPIRSNWRSGVTIARSSGASC